MGWERELLDLFDGLEQQAEALALAERDAEVAELARSEYAEINLAARLHASVGRQVDVAVLGLGPLHGQLQGAGAGWLLVQPRGGRGGPWVVTTGAVTGVRGLAPGARRSPALPATARLGLGSVLRRMAEQAEPLVLVRCDGVRRQGRVGRVGADFVELIGDTGIEVVPFAGVAVLHGL